MKKLKRLPISEIKKFNIEIIIIIECIFFEINIFNLKKTLYICKLI